MAQPNSVVSHYKVLIQIFPKGSGFTCTTSFLFGGNADVVKLRTGDQISWIVQLIVAGGGATLPFTVTGLNPAIFGVTEVSAPKGGFTAPLTLIAVVGFTTYSVSVLGIPGTIDPEIQVDNGSDKGDGKGKYKHNKAAAPSSQYTIVWDPVHNTMQYSQNNGPFHDFPPALDIVENDTVVYEVLNSQTVFDIAFSVNTIWLSPFVQNRYDFSSAPSGTLEATSILTVQPGSNAGSPYTFTASQPGANPSNPYMLNVKPQTVREAE